MPRDLPDLLGDALPRDAGAPDLGAIESRVVRRRGGRLGGAVLALVAAVALAVQVLPNDPPAPMIDQVQDTAPAGTTVLPLPPVGDVAAAHASGRPVFVVHDEDGEVRVLDAISPHPGDNMHGLKVLAYCTRSGWFEDLWHGSKFAGNGAWGGGPAPYGLAEHTVVSTTSETVTVGAMAAAPTREGLRGEEPIGESCIGVLGDNEAPSALVVHDPAAAGAVPGLLYPEVEDGEVVLPDEPQVPLPGDDVTLPLPAPGEVSADHVNGRPVFVRNSGDGSVLVLDAVDPHVTEFGPKVLAWCRRPAASGGEPPPGVGPVDLWYGSHFTSHGVSVGTATGGGGVLPGGWTGGPAPKGLGRLPVRTVTPGTVTVAGSPLPAPPRVGNVSFGSEECSVAVALFPEWSAADPTILDDLVLHEPLFPDDWWYPTPARILGEEPGLPPDELERYLEETGLDRDEAGDPDPDGAVAATACSGGADVLVGDIDLDGDGRPDTVRLHALPDDHVRKLVACLADGRAAVREVGDLLEGAFAVQLGGDLGIALVEVIEITGTTHDAHTLLRVVGGRFVAVGPQDDSSGGLDLRVGELDNPGTVSWGQWGCRTTAAPGGGRPRIELLSSRARRTADGTEVTVTSHEVDGTTTQLLQVSTEVAEGTPEDAATEALAQLGATAQCRPTSD